jgi:hypothetical protein
MLLWETLRKPLKNRTNGSNGNNAVKLYVPRLPFDTRCPAVTKSGRRCRGKINQGRQWCIFHDPELAAKRRRALAEARQPNRHRRLSHLPDGYLRKLTDRRSIGQAMDRLYREIRLEIITPEMGNVLFGVLTRTLDSGLADLNGTPRAPHRTKAERVRPKVRELLTRAELTAWHRAVANAPDAILDNGRKSQQAEPTKQPRRGTHAQPHDQAGHTPALKLQAAS